MQRADIPKDKPTGNRPRGLFARLFPVVADHASVPQPIDAYANLIDHVTIERAAHLAYQNEKYGKRTFNFKRLPERAGQPLRFVTFGCQGSGDDAQRQVAEQLEALCADPTKRPDFILILGDNIYPDGALSPNDPGFKKYFDDIYLKYPHLKDIPFFVIPGNHDANRSVHVVSPSPENIGIPRTMHQVAHSLLPNPDEKTMLYFGTESIELSKIPGWNMLRRYCSLVVEDTEIFCIDSNTYVQEYLDLCKERSLLPHYVDQNAWLIEQAKTNQAAWLQVAMQECLLKNRIPVLAQHHPLYTAGKRAYERSLHDDLGAYITDFSLAQAVLNMPSASAASPYHLCLTECYRQQNIHFKTAFVAHDHAMYNYNNKENLADGAYPICQFTSGGGGGPTQHRCEFSEQNHMGYFIKQTGLLSVEREVGTTEFHCTAESADGLHKLKFNTAHSQAIVHLPEGADEPARFLTLVESAIKDYFASIAKEQDATKGGYIGGHSKHGHDGVERVNQLWAYIKHAEPKSFKEIVADVCVLSKREGHTLADHNSFSEIIKRKMLEAYDRTLSEFAEDTVKRNTLEIEGPHSSRKHK
jgi:hypothetical protein